MNTVGYVRVSTDKQAERGISLDAQRTTLRGIAAALNQRDFRTRRGTPWRLESVARVLKKGRALSGG